MTLLCFDSPFLYCIYFFGPGPRGAARNSMFESPSPDHPARLCLVARQESRGTLQQDHTALTTAVPLGRAPAGVVDFTGTRRGTAGGWAPALLGLWTVGLPPPSSWLRLWASQLRTAGGLRPHPPGGRCGSLDRCCRPVANFHGRLVLLFGGPPPPTSWLRP